MIHEATQETSTLRTKTWYSATGSRIIALYRFGWALRTTQSSSHKLNSEIPRSEMCAAAIPLSRDGKTTP